MRFIILIKSRITPILLLFLVFFASCKKDPNKQVDEGKVEAGFYHSEDIGWTMEIPQGWEVMQRDDVQDQSDKGLKAISETIGSEIDVSGLKQLINLKKDRFHVFLSTSEKFDLTYEGEWEENNEALKQILYDTYTDRGIKVDTSSSSSNIGGLDFNVFSIKLYGPDDKVILYQDMYNRHINGFDFAATLNYLKPKEKNEILRAWKGSKFK
ncbi:hypothetical protein EYD45_10140 [Hyunsoonleella flava]|uniref:Uncharacterized protein n=1 Tax=Hyunsoonleella flava TaxID=2527939 RepID=A0A4Q9FGF8_9FLAO|nr:hypothetical protein [Hyunsoonleella flava]TBN03356.1 hypothetical protein EYD45_10140 [Hyunsoonleella flava]